MAASVHRDTRAAAAHYAETTGQAQHGNFQQLLRAMEISRGGEVLDVGCGPGTQALQVAELIGPEGRIVGYDLSQQRIAEAEERTSKLNSQRSNQGLRPLNVSFGVASGDDLPVSTMGSFTDIYANSATHWFPDLQKFYRDCFALLKPGGRVGTMGSVGAHAAPRNAALSEAPFNVRPVRSATNFRSGEQHKEFVERAGFINCTIETIESTRVFPGGAEEVIQFLQESSSNDFLDVTYLPEHLRQSALNAITAKYVAMQKADGSITLRNDLVLVIADKPFDLTSQQSMQPLYPANLTIEIQAQFGFGLTPFMEQIGRAMYYRLERDGHFAKNKITTYPSTEAVFNFWQYIQHEETIRQDNEYKENILIGQTPLCSFLKWVQSNSANRLLGMPRSNSFMAMRDPLSGGLFLEFDGTAASNSRSFWPVLQLFDLRYAGRGIKRILCIVGTGPTVEAGIRQFADQYADEIDRIILISTPKMNGERPTSHALAERCQNLPVKIEAYTDNHRMLAADMVVTATDAYRAIIDDDKDLRPAVTTIAMSANEYRLEYIAKLVADGQILITETKVEDTLKRGYQALSEYFIAQAPALDQQASLARAAGVLDLSKLEPGDLDDKKTVHASIIGNIGQDAVLATLFAMQIADQWGSKAYMSLLKRVLSLPRNWEFPDACKSRSRRK